MVKLSSKKLVVAAGVLALSLTAGTGVASADPLVDTTCSYPQVIAALNAQDPALAAKLNANPLATSTLTKFLASSPADRQTMITQFQGTTWGQKYFGSITAVANTCNNY